jgi:topoisomerase IA-like protein
LPGFFFIEIFEVQQKSDLFFSKWVFNEMRTSSVSDGDKIEHITLEKAPKLYAGLPRENHPYLPKKQPIII